MKELEKLAIPIVLAYFLARAAANMVMWFGPQLVQQFEWEPRGLSLLTLPLTATVLAVNLLVAVWLFRVARKENASPWCWAMFGLLFGVTGAILFYVVSVREELKRLQAGSTANLEVPGDE